MIVDIELNKLLAQYGDEPTATTPYGSITRLVHVIRILMEQRNESMRRVGELSDTIGEQVTLMLARDRAILTALRGEA